MRQIAPVLNVLGYVATLFALSLMVPLSVSLYTADGAHVAFAEAAGITLLTGLVLVLATRRQRRELQPRDGFLLVTLVWTVLPAVAAVPLMLHSRDIGQAMSFTDAYFEAMSGLTTTGATVMTGLDTLAPSVNLWRCLLNWMGGMGIIVLAVAVLPLLGVGGSQIYKAETPGPMKDDKLTPRITETAKGLYSVYLGLSVLCWIAYWAAGMSLFDAFSHMATTMSLGGFSTYDASFGHFQSSLIEWVAVVFMLIAGINFAVHFTAFRRGSIQPYANCPEARWFLLITIGAAVFITFVLLVHGTYKDSSEAFRAAMFNTVSIATTTGFASTDYAQWPIFAPVLMILLSCFCSSAGSTGGGIKMIRAVLLFRQARRELTRIVHPRAISPVRLGQQLIDNKVIFGVLAFMLMYGVTVIVMTMLLLLSGLDPVTSFTAVIASINNMGPGLGEVGPSTNFQSLSNFQTWICTITMLLGRLEMFTVLVLFTTDFWRR